MPSEDSIRPLIRYYEDDLTFAKAFSRVLETLGGRVELSSSAEGLVEDVVRDLPNLVITDFYHPGMTGIEIVRALRSNLRTASVPIWVISGGLSANGRLALVEAGVEQVLPKPCTSRMLAEVWASTFHTRRLQPWEIDVEAPDLDNKERPTLGTRDEVATLAKDVIAMSNFGGGTIVFGKRDLGDNRFQTVGLSEDDLSSLEVSNVNRALRAFLDPPVHVAPKVVVHRGTQLVAVRIEPGAELVMASRQNDNARLFPGRIYTRTSAAESAEAQTAADVRRIVQRLLDQRYRNEGGVGHRRLR